MTTTCPVAMAVWCIRSKMPASWMSSHLNQNRARVFFKTCQIHVNKKSLKMVCFDLSHTAKQSKFERIS